MMLCWGYVRVRQDGHMSAIYNMHVLLNAAVAQVFEIAAVSDEHATLYICVANLWQFIFPSSNNEVCGSARTLHALGFKHNFQPPEISLKVLIVTETC